MEQGQQPNTQANGCYKKLLPVLIRESDKDLSAAVGDNRGSRKKDLRVHVLYFFYRVLRTQFKIELTSWCHHILFYGIFMGSGGLT